MHVGATVEASFVVFTPGTDAKAKLEVTAPAFVKVLRTSTDTQEYGPSGTFVRVGALRGALVSACGGVLSDAAIAGHDEAYAGALGWLNAGEAERVCGGDAERLRAHLADALARMNSGEGSARRIERLLLLDEPPNMDAGEITDKGYVNQRAVIERRADAVARLYADPPDPGVIVPA